MSKRPEAGEQIRVLDGQSEREHICTVTDLLSTQLTATYEYTIPTGGWAERTLFCFYTDVEWDIQEQRWKGRAG